MSSTIMAYTPNVIVETTGLTEEEWLNYRKRGIGGSDAAVVLGLSPFRTARDLFYDKIGEELAIKEEDNWVAKKYGHLLEDLVAEIFAFKTGLRVYKINKMFSHPLHPFMLADIDYFVEMPDKSTSILECKTTGHHSKDKWDDGAVPINYEMQGRHYMSVMNLNKVFYACLYGNNENDFIYRYIDRDLDYEADLIEQEQYFWEEYVLPKIEPPYTEDGDLVLKSIRRYHGEADKKAGSLKLDRSFVPNIEQFLKLREEKLALDHKAAAIEEQMKKLYAPIVDKMGIACTALCQAGKTEYTVTYSPTYRTTINKENLSKLQLSHPLVYDQYVTTSECRKFSIKQKEC